MDLQQAEATMKRMGRVVNWLERTMLIATLIAAPFAFYRAAVRKDTLTVLVLVALAARVGMAMFDSIAASVLRASSEALIESQRSLIKSLQEDITQRDAHDKLRAGVGLARRDRVGQA